MVIHDITFTSSVDGEGLRTVVWFQGCKHRCKGCHNKHTWDITKGTEIDSLAVINQIREWKTKNKIKELHLTFSGGEPFDQAEAAYDIARRLAPTSLWIYTGYTLEELLRNKNAYVTALLEAATILVDGRYEQKTPPRQIFAGSGNQRIIDMQYFASQKISGLNELPNPSAKNFSEKIRQMVIGDKYTLPDDYVHSSRTRSSDICPKCNRTATEDKPFERIRRITGYLVGSVERFNQGKRAEENDRTKHA